MVFKNNNDNKEVMVERKCLVKEYVYVMELQIIILMDRNVVMYVSNL